MRGTGGACLGQSEGMGVLAEGGIAILPRTLGVSDPCKGTVAP